jgi:photosystem II stability/assembly factor-like uncharacterized protein
MRYILLALFTSVTLNAQWLREESGTHERLRAVSVVSDSVAWTSGNHGTVVRTTDCGKQWTVLKVQGADSLDFRDIEAFDASDAIVLSIGPGDLSRIYRTTNGGESWILQYVANDPRVFLDWFSFWDPTNGIAVGDAIDGHLLILRTTNGGREWTRIPSSGIPDARPGEGAFAASGSGITVNGSKNVWIGSGVNTARVYRSSDRGESWNVSNTPILQNSESSGIFSVAFWDEKCGIAVGGDYKKENASDSNVALTYDGGISWKLEKNSPPSGFRSAVTYLTKEYLITVGPSGSDFSTDGGKAWKQIDMIGYHAIGRARNGKSIWAVGEKGRIGHFADLIVR